ncbi:cupin domain-containing protein [Celerinatantimonas diazotrophica]|uniref:50S ribosomal protein L16 3-hydroxylase n=1 Tax=Celerinatantimonas diazotrophica TaxID=412034 RepID=A0A4V2PNC2_9GAMM|nr:cupin domain-containing protein [Celerinatantimonas diazotrophica]TCK46507.1 50S ribosomal protein L16 3-hydroxylase [Celerinatantimonas diazotrophica]CAG9296557.1 50S ribosomal protein L16 3-hydroxylase [Celerinatantimonas diazotrophica]
MKLNFDINHFMVDYWQRKPLLIRQGITDFIDPLSVEELAGLAMEEELQSRLVTVRDNHWQVQFGPFEQFDELEQPASSLLVQATNHWHDSCAKLAELFHFLPNWRFDDLMISFATSKGGVGPHIDQYGVFIIQGQGQRHWQVGERQNLREFANEAGLKQCDPFEPAIDEELSSGDVLYIPPGCPHNGVSLDNSLSYSIGFRAPDQKELFSAFADHLLDQSQPFTRYNDPELVAGHAWGEITRHQQQKLLGLMQNLLNDNRQMRDFFGRFFSQTRRDIDILPLQEDERFTTEALIKHLEQGAILHRVEGLKVIYLQGLSELFIDGEAYPFDGDFTGYQHLANQNQLNFNLLNKALGDHGFVTQLTQWVNRGFWYWL